MTDKIYIVVRTDIPPGLQAAQACHALREFGEEHPEADAKWYKESKTIVLLGASGTIELCDLVDEAQKLNALFAMNYEPDLDNQLTAVAFGSSAKKLLRPLPLLLSRAGREPQELQSPLPQHTPQH